MKAHGLKGEVTFALGPECPDPESFRTVFIELKNQLIPYFIESVSRRGTKAFVKLEEINTPELASSLRGCSLYLPKTERPKLTTGEFYGDEVVGFEVVDIAFGLLGEVKEVFENGTNRHLIVRRQNKDMMIPLNGPFIKSVSKSRRKISVDLPDGFMDI